MGIGPEEDVMREISGRRLAGAREFASSSGQLMESGDRRRAGRYSRVCVFRRKAEGERWTLASSFSQVCVFRQTSRGGENVTGSKTPEREAVPDRQTEMAAGFFFMDFQTCSRLEFIFQIFIIIMPMNLIP